MARKLIRRFVDDHIGTEWDRTMRRAEANGHRRFLLQWNRGLGDIALGLWQVVEQLRMRIPDAEITIVTRADLAEAFQLLAVRHIVIDPRMCRTRQEPVETVIARVGLDPRSYDVVIPRIDPTRWFRGKPRLRPRLRWSKDFEALSRRFDDRFPRRSASTIYIAVHAQCETANFYSYQKDWPLASWKRLMERLAAMGDVRFVLFGHAADANFAGLPCIDLRGSTSFLEMMAVIKCRCALLIGPDSGIVTMTYFLDDTFPIDVISLWADPRQGILERGAASPNDLLRHVPLASADERIASIAVDDVVHAVGVALARRRVRERSDEVVEAAEAA